MTNLEPDATAPLGQPARYYGPAPHMAHYSAPSGVRFWALGFLWFVPMIGPVAVCVLLGVLAAHERRHPIPLVRENARWAANWAFTVSLVSLIAFEMTMVNMFTVGAGARPTVLVMIASPLFWVAGIAHLTVSILGVTRARSRVFYPRIAIPFMPAA